MRQEGILADSKDISAYLLDTGESERKSRTLLERFAKLEQYILNHIPDKSLRTSCKQLNDDATNNGINTSKEKDIRTLLYFLTVKELLDGGSVGQPLTAEVRLLRPERPEDRDPARLPWRLRREVGGEGYFHDLAPHTLDILDFLLGEITDARGCKSNRGGFYDVADTVAASFRFRSGVPGTGMWCFVAPPSAAEDSVVVTGRKGSVRFSTFDFTPVELVTARGVERFEIAPPEHIQGPLIETIVRELRGEGVCPSTGVSAARTSRVMDEIMKE